MRCSAGGGQIQSRLCAWSRLSAGGGGKPWGAVPPAMIALMPRDGSISTYKVLPSVAHAVFAVTMIALGVLGLIMGDFTPIWLPAPGGVLRALLVYLCAIVPLASGVGLLWPGAAAVASRGLVGLLLAWLLLWDVPHLVLHPGMELTWAVAKSAALVAPAWVLYVWFAGERDRPRRLRHWRRGTAHRAGAVRPGLDRFRPRPFHLYRANHVDGARLAAMASGLGVLLRLYLYRGGRSGAHRRVCTAGSHAHGAAAGYVHPAGVDTRRGGETQRLRLERVRRLLGVDGRRWGGGGLLRRHAGGLPEPMISGQQALVQLREGNRRFVASIRDPAAPLSQPRPVRLPLAQEPFAIVLGCSDARVPAELVFGQGFGDLFVIRVAGNIVAPSQVGSVEFAAARFGTRLAVVLGHTQCGAIAATVEELRQPASHQSPNLRSIVDRIRPSVE